MYRTIYSCNDDFFVVSFIRRGGEALMKHADYIALVFFQPGMTMTRDEALSRLRAVGSTRPEMALAMGLTYSFIAYQPSGLLESLRKPN